jgi:hypothetical protein
MTKNELLLNLAKNAVNWGEGADFEMKELLHEYDEETCNALQVHYPEYFTKSTNETDYPDTPQGYEDFENAQIWHRKEGAYSEKFYDIVRNDINQLLNNLIEKAKTND